MKKLLVVGVIVLFLGLACAPSINANVSKESELVEITTEICGLGGGKHTIQVTREEADKINAYLDSIKEQLAKVRTRNEVIQIFNEVIIELDNYNMLPKSTNVKRIQRLMEGYSYPKDINLLEKYPILHKQFGNTKVNLMCLISGRTNNTEPVLRLYRLLNYLIIILPLWVLAMLLYFNFVYKTKIAFGNMIGLGFAKWDWELGEEYLTPAYGWIYTKGLLGNQSKEGKMRGALNLDIGHFPIGSLYIGYFKAGVLGFTGLKVYTNNSWYYQGFAKFVRIK